MKTAPPVLSVMVIKRVFAGCFTAAFAFDGPDNDRIEQRVGSNGCAARIFEFRVARGLAGIGDQHDGAAPPTGRRLTAFDPSTSASYIEVPLPGSMRFNPACSCGTSLEKSASSRDVFGKLKNAERVTRTNDLPDKMGGGVRLDFRVLECAHAGIDHQGEIERAIGLRLEALDFLRHAFLGKLEGVLREIGDWLAVRIDHAHENADKIRLHANYAGAPLLVLRNGGAGRNDCMRFGGGPGAQAQERGSRSGPCRVAAPNLFIWK